MLPYEIVTKLVFARAIVPDGYFGATREVDVAMIAGRIVGVCPFGYFGLGLPLADSVEEARWLLQRHPAARDIKLVA